MGIRFALFFIVLLLSCTHADKQPSIGYKAGFKTIHYIDKSRIYKPGTDTSNYLHFRPIDLDIWYPADEGASDSLLLVKNLFELFEQRANYYTASDAGKGMAAKIAQLFCDGFKCADSIQLLQFKTNGFKNATAATGKFPLVVYMTAYNGMSYENFVLFEELAKKGFVVVSISSIGRFPGDMTMKHSDLMEQVNDAVAGLNILKQESIIDFDKIGVVGYSWGGLAAAVFAGQVKDIDCFVSLDGSEFHHYGFAKDEDADFDSIKNSNELRDVHLSVPYLRLESSSSAQSIEKDSVYQFVKYHADSAHIYSIDSAQHEDFGCYSLVVREAGNCSVNKIYPTVLNITIGFLEQQLRGESNFSEMVSRELNKTIREK
jgi:Dienelactone hydrolase family